jgi:mRNA-degrading endonuclease RelE of RelBE toxin-antitoxin system
MPWTLIWTAEAKKDLEKLEKQEAKRVYNKVIYAHEAGLLLLEKVKNQAFFKYRIGKYRVFIEKNASQQALFVFAIQHRKNAYKNL